MLHRRIARYKSRHRGIHRQNSVSSSAKLYLDRLAGKLLFTDTVNAGNTNTISVNLAEDLYYYDTKTTHTYGDAFILMLEP